MKLEGGLGGPSSIPHQMDAQQEAREVRADELAIGDMIMVGETLAEIILKPPTSEGTLILQTTAGPVQYDNDEKNQLVHVYNSPKQFN